ncbi:MAG: aminodeoxychorismate synthase component I [Candidatus Omnitrophota bacterium]
MFDDCYRTIFFNPGDDPQQFCASLQSFLDRGFWLCGYIAYEFGYYSEPALVDLSCTLNKPLAWFVVTRQPRVLTAERVAQRKENAAQGQAFSIRNMRANMSRLHYYRALGAIQRHLVRGDTYQVNYTMKLHFDFFGDPLGLYCALRYRQPTAYMAFMNTGKNCILSFSPELFFKRTGRTIKMQPMKGTIAKGRDAREDRALCEALSHDAKSRAENIMIVDLLRSDLGRIATRVTVPQLFVTESHRTLHQMTSTITARLTPGATLGAIFKALFPSGSVTGAPKIRTMQLIHELEKEPRGVYTGALGYCAPDGHACFNVAIRTIDIHGRHGELGVGSGIVYDSQPAAEYQETLLKARFLTDYNQRFSLIETILWEKGYRLLGLHVARLAASCRYFVVPCDTRALRKKLILFAHKLKAPSKVRLVVDLDGSQSLTAEACDETPPRPRIMLDRARVSRRDMFLYHKTTNRQFYEKRLRRARARGFYEVIFRNADGELTEGAFTNLFIKKNQRLYTPPVSCGLLPGVLRQRLIEAGRAREKILHIRDIRQADAVYIGNSVRGLFEVEISLADL